MRSGESIVVLCRRIESVLAKFGDGCDHATAPSHRPNLHSANSANCQKFLLERRTAGLDFCWGSKPSTHRRGLARVRPPPARQHRYPPLRGIQLRGKQHGAPARASLAPGGIDGLEACESRGCPKLQSGCLLQAGEYLSCQPLPLFLPLSLPSARGRGLYFKKKEKEKKSKIQVQYYDACM